MRKIMYLLAGLTAALLLVALLVPLFVNANVFRDPISRQLTQVTGYDVALKGDLSFSLFPFVQISASDVSVRSPLGMNTEPFARITQFEIGVKLLPLLHNRVEITDVRLLAPEITLRQYPRGNNWQPMRKEDEAVPERRAKQEKTANTSSPVTINDIQVKGGALTYIDVATGSSLVLKELAANLNVGLTGANAKIRAVLNDKPVKMDVHLGDILSYVNGRYMPLKASLDAEPVKIALDGQIGQLQYKGKIDAAVPSLEGMIAWLTGKKAGGASLRGFSAAGEMACSRETCGISNAVINLDGQELKGNLRADIIGKPNITAELSAQTIDLSRYLAKKTASGSLVAPAYAAEAPWSNERIDLSALNLVDGSFTLRADRLLADKFAADKLLLRARLNRGALSADGASGDLYGGKGNFTLNLVADGRADMLLMLDGVQLQPLLKAYGSDRFSGQANARIALKTQGQSQKQMVDSLSGEGNIHVLDGSIRGVDIAGMIRNVKTSFNGGDNASKSTDFSEASGNFTVANGVVSNNDLAIRAPLFRVGGTGTINLPAYTIDYLLTPQIVETATGQGGKDKQGLGIPIRVAGWLDAPTYAPDLSKVVEEAVRDPRQLQKNLKEKHR